MQLTALQRQPIAFKLNGAFTKQPKTKQSKIRLASRTENRQKGGRRLKNIRKRKLFAAKASGGRHNQPEKLGGDTKMCRLLPAAAAKLRPMGPLGRTSWDGGVLRLYIMQQELNSDGQTRMKI